MEHSYMSQAECVALTIEKGRKQQRRALFLAMAKKPRYREAILVSLRSLLLFNQEKEDYETKE